MGDGSQATGGSIEQSISYVEILPTLLAECARQRFGELIDRRFQYGVSTELAQEFVARPLLPVWKSLVVALLDRNGYCLAGCLDASRVKRDTDLGDEVQDDRNRDDGDVGPAFECDVAGLGQLENEFDQKPGNKGDRERHGDGDQHVEEDGGHESLPAELHIAEAIVLVWLLTGRAPWLFRLRNDLFWGDHFVWRDGAVGP